MCVFAGSNLFPGARLADTRWAWIGLVLVLCFFMFLSYGGWQKCMMKDGLAGVGGLYR